jgi:predicted nicotinamide N-methyase
MDDMADPAQPRDWVTASPVRYVPEISLLQADAGAGLFDTSGGAYHSDAPPPFWAFAWPGGQALARYLLDNVASVAGRRVLDVGSGSGLVAIAAARAGAASVLAVEVDPDAAEAVTRNAHANGVRVDVAVRDGFDPAATLDADVVTAGDVFYTDATAQRAMRFLRRAERAGARVLVGDAGRGYLPADRFDALATYDVPVSTVVEGVAVRHTTVWEIRTSGPVRREE